VFLSVFFSGDDFFAKESSCDEDEPPPRKVEKKVAPSKKHSVARTKQGSVGKAKRLREEINTTSSLKRKEDNGVERITLRLSSESEDETPTAKASSSAVVEDEEDTKRRYKFSY
jgi:hypothetical protein